MVAKREGEKTDEVVREEEAPRMVFPPVALAIAFRHPLHRTG